MSIETRLTKEQRALLYQLLLCIVLFLASVAGLVYCKVYEPKAEGFMVAVACAAYLALMGVGGSFREYYALINAQRNWRMFNAQDRQTVARHLAELRELRADLVSNDVLIGVVDAYYDRKIERGICGEEETATDPPSGESRGWSA